jgi:hypothetical protein
MTAPAWISLAGLALVFLVQICGTIWWGATVTADIRALKERAKEHGDVRDLVIELRADMKNFNQTISKLGDAIKDLNAPRRRATGG